MNMSHIKLELNTSILQKCLVRGEVLPTKHQSKLYLKVIFNSCLVSKMKDVHISLNKETEVTHRKD